MGAPRRADAVLHALLHVAERRRRAYAPGDHVLIAFKGPPPEVLLWLMNATGVDRAVLQLPPIHLNKFFSRVVHEHPTRFIGLCNVDESTAYTSENLDRLHVYVEELGLIAGSTTSRRAAGKATRRSKPPSSIRSGAKSRRWAW